MSLDKLKNIFPQKSIPYLLVSVVSIAILIVGGILPAITYSNKLQADIENSRKLLKEQQEIINMYQTLLKIPKHDVTGLLMPAKKALKREGIEQAITDFTSLASSSALHVVSIIPELSALTKTSPTMTITVVLRGDFARFRDLLFHINNLAYLERIDEIQIVHIALSKSLEFSLRYKVALQNT